MKKINQIWIDLELEKTLESGLLYKRLSVEVLPPVYIALKHPEKLRCLAVHITTTSTVDSTNLNRLRDIRIEILPDRKHPEKKFFLVVLANNQHKDIFSTLCEDLISRISSITQEIKLIRELTDRLEKWRLLFEKLGQQGLSEEAQRGLYGELFFLRKLLRKSNNPAFCIETWKGPEKAVQDFHYSNWAVEVKTTHGRSHQKIHIASERQLDTNIVPIIILYHLSLDVRESYGESLNDVINELYTIVDSDPVAQNTLTMKLLEAGYFSNQANLYKKTGYIIRQENVFHVTDDFPRITEDMVPSGVGDVRYSLVLPENPDWLISEEELFGIIFHK